MRTKVNVDGVFLELTNIDKSIVLKHAHPTHFTTRQVLDKLAENLTAKLELLTADAVADLLAAGSDAPEEL